MSTGPKFEHSNRLTPEQVASVRRALESVLTSSAFAGSKPCQLLLRLAVERSLAGDLEWVPEPVFDVETLGANPGNDGSNDTVARMRTTEVRKRLAQYYTEAKQTPQVRIEIPPGRYVPEFHWSSRTLPNMEVQPLHLPWLVCDGFVDQWSPLSR